MQYRFRQPVKQSALPDLLASGNSFGYDIPADITLDEFMTCTDCKIPEYVHAMETYKLLDGISYQEVNEEIVTNTAYLYASPAADETAETADGETEAPAETYTIHCTESKSLAAYFTELAADDSLLLHPQTVYPLLEGMTGAQRVVLDRCGLYSLALGLYRADDYAAKRETVIADAMEQLREQGFADGRIWLWTGIDQNLFTKKAARTSASLIAKQSGRMLKDSENAATRKEASTLTIALKIIDLNFLKEMNRMDNLNDKEALRKQILDATDNAIPNIPFTTYKGYATGSGGAVAKYTQTLGTANPLTDLRISSLGMNKISYGSAEYSKMELEQAEGRNTSPYGLSLYATASPSAGSPIIRISVENQRLPLGSGAEPVCLFSGGQAVDLSHKWIDNYPVDYLQYSEDVRKTFSFSKPDYNFGKQDDPVNGIYIYFWQEEQYKAVSDDGTENPKYIGGFSYFMASSKGGSQTYGTNEAFMQTFAAENGFTLVEKDGAPAHMMSDRAGDMQGIAHWRDAEGGAVVSKWNYDMCHFVCNGTVYNESEGRDKHRIWRCTGCIRYHTL